MQRQKEAVAAFCERVGYHVDEWSEDSGSGFKYRRPQCTRLMREIELGQIKRLIFAHKDRFVRFGYEWFADFCVYHQTELVVINGDSLSPEQE